MVRAHITVSGRVQGVYFRAVCERVARSLGLKGWVRNTRDGKVEIVSEGDREAIEALLEWCHHGPANARVKDVEVEWSDAMGEFDSFRTLFR
jgi:acylphosphatase